MEFLLPILLGNYILRYYFLNVNYFPKIFSYEFRKRDFVYKKSASVKAMRMPKFYFSVHAFFSRSLHDLIGYRRRRADALAAVLDNDDDCQREILTLGERDKP